MLSLFFFSPGGPLPGPPPRPRGGAPPRPPCEHTNLSIFGVKGMRLTRDAIRRIAVEINGRKEKMG